MAKLEHGVFGLFMLAQLGPDTGQQNRKLKRLADIVVGPGIETQNRVCVGVMTR